MSQERKPTSALAGAGSASDPQSRSSRGQRSGQERPHPAPSWMWRPEGTWSQEERLGWADCANPGSAPSAWGFSFPVPEGVVAAPAPAQFRGLRNKKQQARSSGHGRTQARVPLGLSRAGGLPPCGHKGGHSGAGSCCRWRVRRVPKKRGIWAGSLRGAGVVAGWEWCSLCQGCLAKPRLALWGWGQFPVRGRH